MARRRVSFLVVIIAVAGCGNSRPNGSALGGITTVTASGSATTSAVIVPSTTAAVGEVPSTSTGTSASVAGFDAGKVYGDLIASVACNVKFHTPLELADQAALTDYAARLAHFVDGLRTTSWPTEQIKAAAGPLADQVAPVAEKVAAAAKASRVEDMRARYAEAQTMYGESSLAAQHMSEAANGGKAGHFSCP